MFRVGELADGGVEVAKVLFGVGVNVIALGVGEVVGGFRDGGRLEGVCAGEVVPVRGFRCGEVGLANGAEVVG